MGAVREEMGNLAENPGPALRGAADHDRIGACFRQHPLRLLGRVDVAVGDHRNRDRLFDGADRSIFNRTGEGARARPAMHGQREDPGVLAQYGQSLRALRCSGSQPVRILSVTGTSTARTTACRIAATSGSFASSAEPAATLQTFFAGQPMLRSMIAAPRSTL